MTRINTGHASSIWTILYFNEGFLLFLVSMLAVYDCKLAEQITMHVRFLLFYICGDLLNKKNKNVCFVY